MSATRRTAGLLLAVALLAGCGGEGAATEGAPPDSLFAAVEALCGEAELAGKAVPPPSSPEGATDYGLELIAISTASLQQVRELPGADAPAFVRGFVDPYDEQLDVVGQLLAATRDGAQPDPALRARAADLMARINAYATANAMPTCANG